MAHGNKYVNHQFVLLCELKGKVETVMSSYGTDNNARGPKETHIHTNHIFITLTVETKMQLQLDQSESNNLPLYTHTHTRRPPHNLCE